MERGPGNEIAVKLDIAHTCWRYHRKSSVHARFPTTLIVTRAYETNRIEFSNRNLVTIMQIVYIS